MPSMSKAQDPIEDGECCGQHLVCERESLLASRPEIEYFEDEDLDALSGKAVEDYTEKDIAELSYVFSTLLPRDVAAWLRSLQLRQIELPDSIREEALMIVRERRYGA